MYDHIKNHINGVESSSYEFFGAHIRDGGVNFTVYAPNAKNVTLIASFNNWNEVQMNRDELGAWSVFIGGICEGTRYKYKIYFPNDQIVEKNDPFAFYNELRPNFASIVYDINNYVWRDDEWIRQRDKNHNKPLNIYEVHLGTWKIKDDKTGDERFYRYEELINELLPYVKDMGYTHIEFLPLNEHPYDGSWGYQASGYYAPTSRYGEPRYLMYLIDVCHQNGIGAILDFVPVHFAGDEFSLSFFDGTCLYESEVPEMRASVWGSIRFDYSKRHVQSFVRSAINFWINYYHFDGIRFDAIGYLIYPDGNPNSPVYDSGMWFIRNTTYTLSAYHPDVMLIAEDSTCFTKGTAPVVYGGLGFDYMWNFGWAADTLRYITTPYGARSQNHNLLTYPMYYFYQNLFILALSHDEVANGNTSIMARVYGRSQEEKFSNLRAYYLFQMTHPGKKMNFMGNELAEYMEWKDTQPLGWNLLTYPNHDSFHEFIKALNKIYKSEYSLFTQDYNPSSFTWIDLQNAANNIYAYRRDDFHGNPLYIVLNFSPYEKEYWLNVGFNGYFRELINSDTDIYGGKNIRNYELRSNDGYLQLRLPPLSGIILKQCDEQSVDKYPVKEEECVEAEEEPNVTSEPNN